jgi:hypothetical protein
MGLFGSKVSNAFYEKGLKAYYTQNDNNTQTIHITPTYKETKVIGSVLDGIAIFIVTQNSEETYGYFERPEEFTIILNGPYDAIAIECIKEVKEESLHTSIIITSEETLTYNHKDKQEEVTYRDVIEELTLTLKAKWSNRLGEDNNVTIDL